MKRVLSKFYQVGKSMREFKYLDESRTKVGKLYLNRLDYFEFYSFEGELSLKVKCGFFIIILFLGVKYVNAFFVLPILWILYVLVLTLFLIFKKRCRYKGYFFFPSRIVKKFRDYEKKIDLLDFDCLATMEKSGAGKFVVLKKYNYRN